MTKEEKLYEVLGELLYAIAIADGIIQAEETNALEDLFKDHKHGDQVKWSFNYEVKKKSTIEEIYHKVINYCHAYGASPIYNEFIEAMQSIAEADGISKSESNIINSFSADLIKRFQKDAEDLIRLAQEE